MAYKIPEADWKKLRAFQNAALKKACDRALDSIAEVAASRGTDSHQAYQKIWRIMKREDEQIARMFDDLKRSTAIFKLALWKKNGVLSDEDFGQLTEETQHKIQTLCDTWR